MQRVFCGKTFKISNAPSVSCFERGLALISFKVFDKKTGNYGVKVNFVGVTNHQLENKLHQSISFKNS